MKYYKGDIVEILLPSQEGHPIGSRFIVCRAYGGYVEVHGGTRRHDKTMSLYPNEYCLYKRPFRNTLRNFVNIMTGKG